MYKKIQSYLKMINSLMTSKRCVIFFNNFVNVAKNIGENSIPINNEHPSIVNIQENLKCNQNLISNLLMKNLSVNR